MKKAFLFPLLGLALAVVHGRALAAAPLVDVNRPFEEQRSTILAELNDGTTYSEISADDRRRVVSSLNRISGLLDNREASELPEATRVEVFNEQELVNALLAGAREDSRLVCKREKKTGSNRPTNNCMTVAERRRAQEESQAEMQKLLRRPISP